MISPIIDNLCTDKLFECCITKFKSKNTLSFVLAGVYRKPQFQTNEFLSRLHELIGFLMKIEWNVIIAGDINIDILKRSHETIELKNVLTCHGLIFG